eukprot:5089835-Prymnesium_polylepis.1
MGETFYAYPSVVATAWRGNRPYPIGDVYGCHGVKPDGGRENRCLPPALCESRSPESFGTHEQATTRRPEVFEWVRTLLRVLVKAPRWDVFWKACDADLQQQASALPSPMTAAPAAPPVTPPAAPPSAARATFTPNGCDRWGRQPGRVLRDPLR